MSAPFRIWYANGDVFDGSSRIEWEGSNRFGVVKVAQADHLPFDGDFYFWMDGVIHASNTPRRLACFLLGVERLPAGTIAEAYLEGCELVKCGVTVADMKPYDEACRAWLRERQECAGCV